MDPRSRGPVMSPKLLLEVRAALIELPATPRCLHVLCPLRSNNSDRLAISLFGGHYVNETSCLIGFASRLLPDNPVTRQHVAWLTWFLNRSPRLFCCFLLLIHQPISYSSSVQTLVVLSVLFSLFYKNIFPVKLVTLTTSVDMLAVTVSTLALFSAGSVLAKDIPVAVGRECVFKRVQ